MKRWKERREARAKEKPLKLFFPLCSRRRITSEKELEAYRQRLMDLMQIVQAEREAADRRKMG